MTTTITPSPQTGEGGPAVADPPPGADARTAAAELLAMLRAAGFTVTAADGKVFVRPRADLAEGTCRQIAANKPGLLLVLAEERWTRCQMCLHHVDSGCPDDVQRLCGVTGCPYRRGRR